MKSRDTLLRLKRFQVDERRRRVMQIETMIAEFERMVGDLEREVETEEQKAGINDKAHFAYPTYARAALQRRDNLQRSADELRAQLVDARDELTESVEELKKFEIIDDREQQRERAIETAREQAELDRMAYRVRGGFAGA